MPMRTDERQPHFLNDTPMLQSIMRRGRNIRLLLLSILITSKYFLDHLRSFPFRQSGSSLHSSPSIYTGIMYGCLISPKAGTNVSCSMFLLSMTQCFFCMLSSCRRHSWQGVARAIAWMAIILFPSISFDYSYATPSAMSLTMITEQYSDRNILLYWGDFCMVSCTKDLINICPRQNEYTVSLNRRADDETEADNDATDFTVLYYISPVRVYSLCQSGYVLFVIAH